MVKVIGKGLEGLAKFIDECFEKGGVPTFVAEYGGVTLHDKVIVRCYGVGRGFGGTIVDVPKDVIELILRSRNDWKKLVEYLRARGFTIPHAPSVP